VRRYLRSLAPGLTGAAWRLQAGGLVNSVGTGLVYPFLLIYLTNVRDLPLELAGLAVGVTAVMTVFGTPVVGAAIDRFGARPMLTVALLLQAVGWGLFPLIREPWHAFVLAAIAGAGTAAFWPSQSTLLIGVVGPDRRDAAFAVQRITQNFGMALGAAAGGLIATTSDAGTYTALFLLDAATFVAYALLLTAVKPPRREPEPPGAAPPRYREVLANRVFVAVVVINVVIVAAAYAQFDATLPVFAKNEVGISERGIGALFFVNMIVVALAQLPITRALAGRSRVRAIAASAWLASASFLLVVATALWLEGGQALALLLAMTLGFTIAETLHGATQSALVADLAPERLRGRYMSLLTNSYALGFSIGPALGAVLLARSDVLVWVAASIALALAALALHGVESRVPVHARLAGPAGEYRGDDVTPHSSQRGADRR
jgi:MFS family permease